MLSFQRFRYCSSTVNRNALICVLNNVFSTTAKKTPEQTEQNARKLLKKKETHISLIQLDNSISHTTLEDATKLSTRRNLKLIKVKDYDKKRDCPVYQLVTAVKYREEMLNLKRSSEEKKGPYKGEKLMPINAKIGEHDLESKVKKMCDWVDKKFEVRVTISGSTDAEQSEKVYKKIESSLSTKGRILQKRMSGNDIKFQIVPPKQSSTKENPERTSNEENAKKTENNDS